MTLVSLARDVLGPTGAGRFVRVVAIVYTARAVLRMSPQPRRRFGRARLRATRRTLIPAVAAGAALVMAAGSVYALTRQSGPSQLAKTAMDNQAPAAAAYPGSARIGTAMKTPGIGVFEPGATASYQPVDEFAHATGVRPEFVVYYSRWGDPFQGQFADRVNAAGAVPVVQMQPLGVPLQAIVAGGYDDYLRSFASTVRGFGQRVIMSFAPEMNGTWDSWGAGHTAPSVWIAAWRHVVDVFRAAGASNVTWLWTVNSVNGVDTPLRLWWPGASYVNWVGIDGYYFQPADTFRSVFGTTLSELHTFTAAPVLIAETAAAPSPEQAAQIKGLFAGIRAYHLRGAVWFDMAQHDGPYHLDWRLEDSLAGLAAFRSAAEGGSHAG